MSTGKTPPARPRKRRAKAQLEAPTPKAVAARSALPAKPCPPSLSPQRPLPEPLRNAASIITLPTALRVLGGAATGLAKVAPEVPLRDAVTIGAMVADLFQRGAKGGAFPLTRLALGTFYSDEEAAPHLATLPRAPAPAPDVKTP